MAHVILSEPTESRVCGNHQNQLVILTTTPVSITIFVSYLKHYYHVDIIVIYLQSFQAFYKLQYILPYYYHLSLGLGTFHEPSQSCIGLQCARSEGY